MNSDIPDLKSIFGEALAIESAEQRAHYLDRACRDNPMLRAEVEDLLASSEGAGSFMEAPALDATIDQDSGVADRSSDSMEPVPTEFSPTVEGVGSTIGPFKLLQRLGEGGMGTVYLAEQTKPVRRKVALKIIKPGMDTRQVIARFEAERQALALMDHIHIARVLDAGATTTGRPYFVMELVKGVPITKYCDENKLSPRQRLELFIPVCLAIQHAHQKGIIHRDVKPSNVLVTLYDGKPVPKVIDFGIAKATGQQLTEKTMFTEVGQIVGTMEYMSPEQAEMNQLDIDTRSDIYSLGILLYELLTGTTPITKQQLRNAGFTEMLRVIRESEPQKPSTRISESGEALPSISAVRSTEPARLSRMVRGDLDWVVMKSIEKDRDRRYDTASAFADDIARYLSHEPVQAGPPSSLYRMRRFAGKHRASITTAAALILLLVSGIVISTWQAYRAAHAERRAKVSAAVATREAANAREQESIAKAARSKSDQLAEREKQSRWEAEQSLYFLRLASAQDAIAAGDGQTVGGILADCSPRLRGWEWYYLKSQTRPTAINVRDFDFPADAAFSPDGQRLASWMGSTGALTIWNVKDGTRRYTLWPKSSKDSSSKDSTHRACPPVWSPDGKSIAWLRDGESLELIVADSGETAQSWPAEHAALRLAFHPEGKQIAALARDQRLRVWDVSSKKLIHESEITCNEAPWQFLAWSHDASKFAVGADVTVRVFDAADWNVIERLEAHITVPFWGWAPNSNRLLFAARIKPGEDASMVSIWEQGQPAIPVTTWYDDAFHFAWSPDGKQVAWINHQEGTVHINDSSTGALQRSFSHGHDSLGRCVAWHQGGKRLASAGADGKIKIWDLESDSDGPVAEVLGHQRQARWVGWNPDGSANVASYSTDKSICFWNLDAQVSEQTRVVETLEPMASLSWGPDGHRLAGASTQVSESAKIRIWDAATGDLLGEPFPGGEFTSWSRENRMLCTPPDRWSVLVVDPGTEFDMMLVREDRPESPEPGVVKGSGVCWSPDGRWLAMATFDGVYIWDYALRVAGEVPADRKEGDRWARSLVWHPDSSKLAVVYRGSIHEIVVYHFDRDRKTLRPLWRKRRPQIGYSYPGELAWSPGGDLIAMGDADNSIRLWNAVSGELVSTHRGHTSGVSGIDWNPTGSRFVSASADGTLRIWSPSSKHALLVLHAHDRSANDVKWHADGMRLASAGSDKRIRIWDARTGFLAARAPLGLDVLDQNLPTAANQRETMEARIEILVQSEQWEQAGDVIDELLKLPQGNRAPAAWYATHWWVLGPYQETHLDAPESVIDAESLQINRDRHEASTGQPTHTPWHYLAKQTHYINLLAEFDADGIAAYARKRVYSPTKLDVRLTVRADDAVAVWVNGRVAHKDPDDRVSALADRSEEILTTLRPGWNDLLFKVVNAANTDRYELFLEVSE